MIKGSEQKIFPKYICNYTFFCTRRILVQRFGPEKDPLRVASDEYRDTVGFFIAKFIKEF